MAARAARPAQELQALAALTPADVNGGAARHAVHRTQRYRHQPPGVVIRRGFRPQAAPKNRKEQTLLMTNHVQFPGLGLSFTLDRVAFTVFGMPDLLVRHPHRQRAWLLAHACSHSGHAQTFTALIPTAWWM